MPSLTGGGISTLNTAPVEGLFRSSSSVRSAGALAGTAGAGSPGAGATNGTEASSALEAAQAFEKLLIHDMLKTMRRSAAVLGEEPSEGRAMYDDMLDERLAGIMSEAGGLGLAEALAGRLDPNGRRRGDGESDAEEGTVATRTPRVHGLATAEVLRLRSLRRPPEDTTGASERIGPNGPGERVPGTASRVPGTGAGPDMAVLASGGIGAHAAWSVARTDGEGPTREPHRAERQAFIEPLLPHARLSARRLGTSPDAVLAIAALESGWGRSVAQGVDGRDSNNLFGIKARPGERDAVSHRTTEYLDGERQSVVAAFRAYDDRAASVEGFADFVLENPRYAKALAHAADPPEFLRRLHEAGYATDPHYADKAIRVMQSVRALQENPS